MLVGGAESPLRWTSHPVSTYSPSGSKFKPEEPDWWPLPDGRVLGLFRDNGRSNRLFRAVSADNGVTWTPPEITNFPDATSKFFGLRTSRGYWVLVSSANPAQRNPLCLSTSDDGVTFTSMASLPVPEAIENSTFDKHSRYKSTKYDSLQYPHVIENGGHVLVAFSRRKQTIEVVKVSLDEIDRQRREK
jgi:predicted neuraminidase